MKGKAVPGSGAAASALGLALGVIAAAFACARPAPPAVPLLAWTVQASGSDAGLRGISAVDDLVAWASGSKGAVLRTVDGGSTWTAVPIAGEEASDFRDIEAFGPDDAVVMAIARPAKIFRTRDGGKTWARTFFDDSPGIFLDGMAFFDDRNGLAVGDPMDGRFLLIATSDGGGTWTPAPPASRPAAAEGEAAFAASGTSLAVHGNDRIWLTTGGPVSRVWRSADRGARWEAVPSRLLEGSASSGGFGVAFLDERRGIAVGGDYRAEAEPKGTAAVTDDGGRTWIAVGDRGPGGFREAVAFVPRADRPFAVAVGPAGSDLSIDLGRTWTPLAGPTGFHSISFAKRGRTAWAVGRNGLIAKLER